MILRAYYLLLIILLISCKTGYGFFIHSANPAHYQGFISSLTPDNDSLKAAEFLNKGKVFGKQRQFDSATYYTQKSMELCFKNKFWDCYQVAGADLVLSLIYREKLDSASRVNQRVRQVFENGLTTDTTTYSRLLNFQAGIYNMTKKLDSGIMVMKRLIQLDKLLFKDSVTLLMAGSYNNMGAMYTDYQVYDKALKYYDSAMYIHQQLSERQSEDAARVYSNKAVVLRSLGKFEESLEHNMQSHTIFKSILPADHPRLAFSHFNIAHDLIERNDNPGDIAEALGHLSLGEKILNTGGNHKHTYMIDFYRYSAKANQVLQNYDLAISLFSKAIDLDREIYGDKHPDIGIYQEELAEVYRINGDFAAAEDQLREALELFKEEIGIDFKRVALVYSTMGSVAADRKEFIKSIELYNKAISYFIPEANFQNPLDNPPLDKLVVDQNLFLILQKKSVALLDLYKTQNDLKYLEATLKSYVFLSDYIQFSRKGFFGTLSKLKFNENVDKVYQQGIEIAIELYENTGQQKALQQALMFSDAYKSGILLENIEDNQAKVFANIPEDLLNRETELKASIDLTKKSIFELKNEANQPANILRDLEAKQFFLKAELENLSKAFESQYPAYYQIKYNLNQTSTEHLKTNILGNGQYLIQYFLGDSVLYTFGLTRQGITYNKKSWNSHHKDQIQSFLSAVRQRDFDHYTREGVALYQILLEEILDQYEATNQGINNLIIIPDGILGYIPFEILIKNPVRKPGNYLDLDYLIKDFEISYHYSANLLSLEAKRRPSGNIENTFIGFAPEFSGVGNQQLIAFNDVERSYLDSASALPQARREVEVIAGILDGIANLGPSATEYNFKQQSRKAGIIHLASHSLINDEEPLYSKLIFDSRNDTIEDGLLHTYELYNMQLNADLACLSACNTGIGKYYHGEGIMSLARGFMYAGVPNVMMSLWPVSDQSTRDIMQYFYEELAEGTSKSKALRLAKLKYLEQADPLSANPYYWGGFIFLGKVNAVSPISGLKIALGAFIGLLLIALVAFILKRRFGKPKLLEQH